MISKNHDKLSVRKQSSLLALHRSTIYYQPSPVTDDPVLMNSIHELWLEHNFYGYRKITHALKRNGHLVNYKRILRLMRLMGLQAVYPKKKLSIANKEHRIYPYLLKNITVTKPNQVWTSDITYIRLANGFAHLVCLLDLHSRYIVAWKLSNCLSTDFCESMLCEALNHNQPEIVNTDKGAKFTSTAWTNLLIKNNIKISMDGVGRCMDNINIKRFWRTLKYEDSNLMAYETMKEAHNGIRKFIKFYNNERPHAAIAYKVPAELYKSEKSRNVLPAKVTITDGILVSPSFL